MLPTDVLEKIRRAREEISVAETELDGVFRLTKISEDREKVAVSNVLEDAFKKLRDAKVALAQLEESLTKKK